MKCPKKRRLYRRLNFKTAFFGDGRHERPVETPTVGGLRMKSDRLQRLTFQQLEALVCLVEERSFSRAGKRMFLTQPALTKNIGNIEEALGAKVVNRSTAGVTLTPNGKILYDYARRILRLRREAGDKIARLQENFGGDIDLCASTIPATYILPHVMSALQKTHPDIRVFLQTEDSEEVINRVLDREVALGIIGKKPQNPKLLSEALWHDRLILVVPKGHRWIRKKTVDLDELLAEPFLLREKGSATRDVFEAHLKAHCGISLSQFHLTGELGSSEAIKEAVMAGLGVSVLSVHAVRRELASKTLSEIAIANGLIEREFHLIHSKPFEFPPCYQTFIDFLRHYRLEFAQT